MPAIDRSSPRKPIGVVDQRMAGGEGVKHLDRNAGAGAIRNDGHAAAGPERHPDHRQSRENATAATRTARRIEPLSRPDRRSPRAIAAGSRCGRQTSSRNQRSEAMLKACWSPTRSRSNRGRRWRRGRRQVDPRQHDGAALALRAKSASSSTLTWVQMSGDGQNPCLCLRRGGDRSFGLRFAFALLPHPFPGGRRAIVVHVQQQPRAWCQVDRQADGIDVVGDDANPRVWPLRSPRCRGRGRGGRVSHVAQSPPGHRYR